MVRGFVLAFLLLSAAPAAAQEGVYQSETIEVGAQLVLAPDGRFLWQFAYGSLDMLGAGTWARADGGVVLTSDAGVVAPRFELVGRRRDDAPGVAVRLACDTGEIGRLLNVVTEHADGENRLHRFDNLAFRSEAAPAVTAVRLGSESFGLLSERFPVDPGEANVLTFRFIPNDLGRADFRGERATLSDGLITLNWNGMPVRYRRQGSAAGETLPPLPPSPRARADAAPVPVAVTLFESPAELRARAGAALITIPGEEMMIASGPIDLRLGYGESQLDLGRADAGPEPLLVTTGSGEGGEAFVGGVRFNAAPATLAEALGRAEALQAALERAGFRAMPGADALDRPPFTIDGDDGWTQPASDWAGAARVLGDEARGIDEMGLYVLRTRDVRAEVRIENARRIEAGECAHSEWPSGGRDWRLAVAIQEGRAPGGE